MLDARGVQRSQIFALCGPRYALFVNAGFFEVDGQRYVVARELRRRLDSQSARAVAPQPGATLRKAAEPRLQSPEPQTASSEPVER